MKSRGSRGGGDPVPGGRVRHEVHQADHDVDHDHDAEQRCARPVTHRGAESVPKAPKGRAVIAYKFLRAGRPRRADDAHRNLSTIGNQDLAEHRHVFRSYCQFGLRFSRKADRPSLASSVARNCAID